MNDIRRFGPAIILSTETFESFNAVFRRCSVLSNHQAPSRDIAFNMADISRFKHIASGGKWKEKCGWTGPGKGVTNFFSRHDELQQLLGWADTPKKFKGMHVSLQYIIIIQPNYHPYIPRRTHCAKARKSQATASCMAWHACSNGHPNVHTSTSLSRLQKMHSVYLLHCGQLGRHPRGKLCSFWLWGM